MTDAQYAPYGMLVSYLYFTVEVPDYILGDADFDGTVEVRDATWIQRYAAEKEIPFTIAKATADVDGDDEITVMDATYIQRWLADMPSNSNIGS